ncbi:PDR/VanB family oxidoreductase [Nocardia stercoris]|uniref:Oxidoreductase n=1 Tax=Nocardia stercoris TaxID=2483361 RepID=A0A3M2L5Y9_9NOCA|nr:PDR/VanB family oxidoreductase [Nocardia stercoris]RMI29978.1 oxidoreductase [Nocardia stercoris]
MSRIEIPVAVPPDLYGKHRHDPTTRVLDAVATAKMAWSARLSRKRLDLAANGIRFPAVVTARTPVAADDDVVSVTFESPDGGALPLWQPGAHIDLELPSGRVSQYSLCGDPADRSRYRIAVRRIPDGSGGSVEVHDALPIGTQVALRGPRNAFPFAATGSTTRRLHFVAGGIGITPILTMVRAADRLAVPWTLVYCGRTRAALPFRDELAAYGDRVTIRTDDEHGIPAAADLLAGVERGTAVYCCGPTPMTAAVLDALRTADGIEFHSERFSPAPVVDGSPFTVTLAATGEQIDVAADETMLTALLRARPNQPYSCRQGFCRTCVLRVLDGHPDHRDTVLTPEEHADGRTLACVSRCHGDGLVVDL